MNDEIKEILEEFLKEKSAYSLRYSFNGDLAYSQEQILKDYITNLQEENEKYKKIFEGKERFSKIMPEDIDFIILSKSDYDRQEKDIQLELIDYKSRCEKAIEYIEDNTYKSYETDYMDLTGIKELLNILNGGDE